MEVMGIGVASDADLADSANPPQPVPAMRASSVSAAAAALTEFKKSTRQRYLDESVGVGLLALDNAFRAAAIDQSIITAAPTRTGLLLATGRGPVQTRAQFLDSYFTRGRKSASATLFSNSGYNILGAMLARSQSIQGPVLTFGTGRCWSLRLLEIAQRFIDAGRVDRLVVGHVAAEGAVMVALGPLTAEASDPACVLRMPRPGEIRVASRTGAFDLEITDPDEDFFAALTRMAAASSAAMTMKENAGASS
jgi:3-oxoacyl-(acyl-carrier-protein) synthase